MNITDTIKSTFTNTEIPVLNKSEMVFKNVASSAKSLETNKITNDIKYAGIITKTLYFPIMKMEYPTDVNSVNDKMKYEAHLAKANLTAQESKEIINKLLDTLLIKIEANPVSGEEMTYQFIGYKQKISQLHMPIYNELPSIQNKSDFIAALKILQSNEKEPDYAVIVLSFLWNVTRELNWLYNRPLVDDIDDAYANIQLIGKQDKVSPSFEQRASDGIPHQRLKPDAFGAAQISSNLNARLSPIYLLKHYYMKDTDNKDYKPLISEKEEYPYLAGISGMCNLFYNTFDLIEINYPSTKGCKIADLMSSFVVGIGFHTFQECYDAFNFTHYYVEESQRTSS